MYSAYAFFPHLFFLFVLFHTLLLSFRCEDMLMPIINIHTCVKVLTVADEVSAINLKKVYTIVTA